MFGYISKLRKEAYSKVTAEDLEDTYGIKFAPDTDPKFFEVMEKSLKKLPPKLVEDCKVIHFGFEDMGPSKRYYPNHGKYIDGGTLIINENILDDDRSYSDDEGNILSVLDQILYHELGHGWDYEKGKESPRGIDLSLQKEWLSLSDWTQDRKPGYKRMVIRDKGKPELKDDWYYSPEAKFTRYYAKRNPWDDWADSFSFYVAGLKSFLPSSKVKYFDEKLKEYYKEN